jgi:TonB family protein
LILERQGKTEQAAMMYAERSDRFTEENSRFLDLNQEDRDLFQSIAQSEEALAEIEKLRNRGALGSRAGQKTAAGEIGSIESTNRDNESSDTLNEGALVPLYLVDEPPVLRVRVDPEYPPSPKALGVEGKVEVNALISETGNVLEVVIIEGQVGGFNSSTVKAVMQWKYEPAVKDGMRVKVWQPITVTFKLK